MKPLDIASMVALKLIQEGDRVFAEPDDVYQYPRGWGVVSSGGRLGEIYDGQHLYAVWDSQQERGRFGVRVSRITKWEPAKERME
jgi:hypothetical protein